MPPADSAAHTGRPVACRMDKPSSMPSQIASLPSTGSPR